MSPSAPNVPDHLQQWTVDTQQGKTTHEFTITTKDDATQKEVTHTLKWVSDDPRITPYQQHVYVAAMREAFSHLTESEYKGMLKKFKAGHRLKLISLHNTQKGAPKTEHTLESVAIVLSDLQGRTFIGTKKERVYVTEGDAVQTMLARREDNKERGLTLFPHGQLQKLFGGLNHGALNKDRTVKDLLEEYVHNVNPPAEKKILLEKVKEEEEDIEDGEAQEPLRTDLAEADHARDLHSHPLP